jgi:NhaP-type Na+/H+ or K+/H+ antiporter
MSAGAAVDKEITDVFALLGVLLVFVFAFLSALLALTGPVLDAEVPDELARRKALSRRAQTYFVLLAGLDGVIVLVAALVFDVTRRSITTPPQGADFPTVRAGLWLVDLLLLVTLVGCSWLAVRMLRKRKEADEPPGAD